MYNILVCDDEKDIVSALRIYLTSEGYGVVECYNGKEALEILERKEPEIHLVLLDVMMPVMDGIAALAGIRKISNVPVILLTAKSEDTDKVLGLNVGADDYVTKPFNPVELQARVKSGLRRYLMLGGRNGSDEADTITIGPITLNDRAKEVTLDGERVNLTRTEYDILYLLMKNPGQVFSPAEIYRKVWQGEAYGTENTVAVHIRHLREKLEYDPADPRFLKVLWGRGYKMEDGRNE
jgi:DNA-binding response OmpR family regulator